MKFQQPRPGKEPRGRALLSSPDPAQDFFGRVVAFVVVAVERRRAGFRRATLSRGQLLTPKAPKKDK